MSPDSAPIAAELGARMMFFVQYPIAQHLPGIESYRQHYLAHQRVAAPPVLTTDFCLCDRDAGRAEAMARRYIAAYFLSVLTHYEFLGEHFGKAKGYEAYANAAEMLRQAGQEAATDAFVDAQSWGTPQQILDKLERRRATIGDFELNVVASFAGLPSRTPSGASGCSLRKSCRGSAAGTPIRSKSRRAHWPRRVQRPTKRGGRFSREGAKPFARVRRAYDAARLARRVS